MKQLIKWQHAYENIAPAQLDEYFRKGEPVNQTLAELLLNNDSAAIFHVEPSRTRTIREQEYMEPLLLGVNYHKAHSEGDYKIIVQNIPERRGPWVLFRPPSSDEHTLYLQSLIPGIGKPKFKDNVANPNKHFGCFYLFSGNPLQIFEDFKKKGFSFVDHAMPEGHYEHLERLSNEAGK